jgi:hypothetical protein
MFSLNLPPRVPAAQMLKHGSGDRHRQPATHLANRRAALFGVHPGIQAQQGQTNPRDLDAEMMTRLPVATAEDHRQSVHGHRRRRRRHARRGRAAARRVNRRGFAETWPDHTVQDRPCLVKSVRKVLPVWFARHRREVKRPSGVLGDLRAGKYNSPPNWPAPPPGWTPPKGWRPDPAWGPALAGAVCRSQDRTDKHQEERQDQRHSTGDFWDAVVIGGDEPVDRRHDQHEDRQGAENSGLDLHF